jgi:DNA-binding NtrC family response regulator
MNAPTPKSSRHSILVVDDDVSLLDAMERALREGGEDVTACSSFEEARHVLRDRTFDALITDVRLGAFNGLQLAVMARDIHPDIQLIVFSGFDDPVLRADAEQIGAQYLVKPVASSYLLSLLRAPRSV